LKKEARTARASFLRGARGNGKRAGQFAFFNFQSSIFNANSIEILRHEQALKIEDLKLKNAN
jgi:hypothetical protein